MGKLITRSRRFVQWLSLVVLNTNFWGGSISAGIGGVSLHSLCVPVMNCEACLLAWLGCPIGRMSEYIAFHSFPWLVLGIVVVIGLAAGRVFCGWVCPLGLVQDLLHKIPVRKIALPRFLGYAKYGFLAVTVIAVAYWFGKERMFFFCNFCPTATLQVVIPGLVMGQDVLSTLSLLLRFAVLALFLVFAALNHRSFCKVMCPIGAMVALTNKFTLFRIRVNDGKCIRCSKCDKACPMDVKVMRCGDSGRSVNRDAECIECLSCQAACPVKAIGNNVPVKLKGD